MVGSFIVNHAVPQQGVILHVQAYSPLADSLPCLNRILGLDMRRHGWDEAQNEKGMNIHVEQLAGLMGMYFACAVSPVSNSIG